MSLLSAITPLLHGSDYVQATIAAGADGGLVVTLVTKLSRFDADAQDGRQQKLQAALARPLRIAIPAGADPDRALAEALDRVTVARGEAVDALATYVDGLAAARATPVTKKQPGKLPSAATPAPGTVGGADAQEKAGVVAEDGSNGGERAPSPADERAPSADRTNTLSLFED